MSTPPDGSPHAFGDFIDAMNDLPNVFENVVEAVPVVAKHIIEDAPFHARGQHDGALHTEAELPGRNREHNLAYVEGYLDGWNSHPTDPFGMTQNVPTPNGGPTMGPNTMSPEEVKQGQDWEQELRDIRQGTAWGEHEAGHEPHPPDDEYYPPDDPITDPTVQME